MVITSYTPRPVRPTCWWYIRGKAISSEQLSLWSRRRTDMVQSWFGSVRSSGTQRISNLYFFWHYFIFVKRGFPKSYLYLLWTSSQRLANNLQTSPQSKQKPCKLRRIDYRLSIGERDHRENQSTGFRTNILFCCNISDDKNYIFKIYVRTRLAKWNTK